MSSAILEKVELQKGQASVKGSTETMRMILLAFSAVGITYGRLSFSLVFLTLSLSLFPSLPSPSLIWFHG